MIVRACAFRSFEPSIFALCGLPESFVRGVHGLGPGLITGVADDDPSGISTYTIAGATFGYQLLWLSLLTFPLNVAVQSICARIGLVSGRGLAANLQQRGGRRWLVPVVALLAIANTVNIGADIGAIAAAIELLVGIPTIWLVLPVGLAVAFTEVLVPYPTFARVLKLLCFAVFAYVIGAFFASPDWSAAARGTFAPSLPLDREGIATIVAIFGTTISPYLFFWQASEEVEEEEAIGLMPKDLTPKVTRGLIHAARIDIAAGMATASIGFYFVVLDGGGSAVCDRRARDRKSVV